MHNSEAGGIQIKKKIVEITLFGQLTDIAGSNTITVNNCADTDSLVNRINVLYPAMKGVKYLIAVNKKVMQTNTAISENSMVALLPPFSGG